MRTGLNASDIPATENGLALLSANEVHIPSEDFWFHFRRNAADGFSGWTSRQSRTAQDGGKAAWGVGFGAARIDYIEDSVIRQPMD